MSPSSTSKRRSLGLSVCVNPEDALIDVVFVHGLTGDRESTWTDVESKIFWPKDFLAKDIPQARILTFGYDADFVHFSDAISTNRIGEHANDFANQLGRLREGTPSCKRPILFVAHSLGGLLVKDALLAAKDNCEQYIRGLVQYARGIVFLGTPHFGTDKAKWASLLANFASVFEKGNTGLPGVLKPDSEVLARINNDFHQMISIRSQENQPPIEIKCFFEVYPYKGVIIVPKESAKFPGYNFEGIYANHVDMCKFDSVDDPGYQAISFQLRYWLKMITAETQLREELSLHPKGNSQELERTELGDGEVYSGASVVIGGIYSGHDSQVQIH